MGERATYRVKLAMYVRADICNTARSENVHPQVLPDPVLGHKEDKTQTLLAIQRERGREGETESRKGPQRQRRGTHTTLSDRQVARAGERGVPC